jgi:C4-dicarboxylate transporter
MATILPLLATQGVINGGVPSVCAFAATGMLATSIAAADAPMSQRHAYLKD